MGHDYPLTSIEEFSTARAFRSTVQRCFPEKTPALAFADWLMEHTGCSRWKALWYVASARLQQRRGSLIARAIELLNDTSPLAQAIRHAIYFAVGRQWHGLRIEVTPYGPQFPHVVGLPNHYHDGEGGYWPEDDEGRFDVGRVHFVPATQRVCVGYRWVLSAQHGVSQFEYQETPLERGRRRGVGR